MTLLPEHPCKPTICFVAPDALAALNGEIDSHVGGAELQQTLIARKLVDRGYDVSFIANDHGQADAIHIGGIRVFKAAGRSEGMRGLRCLHPRLTSLWRAMQRCDADIYFQRTSDSATGLVAAFCRQHDRKFVFSVASDADCLKHLPHCPSHEKPFYRYGLTRADRIIAQTKLQQQLLEKNFGVRAIVIRNCGEDFKPNRLATDTNRSACERVLWVGRISPDKRIEMLLDVAARLQQFTFDVVGDGPALSDYARQLRTRAENAPNVHLHGKARHSTIGQFYSRAATLLCTSRVEGFPNTLIEAWSHGLPVVSTFDPDGVIAQYKLGTVCRTVGDIVADLELLLTSRDHHSHASRRARQYYLHHHAPQAVVPQFERLFLELVGAVEAEEGTSP